MNESQLARFNIYLKYFTDGNVSLDYLKNIIVRTKILKAEKGLMLDRFPNFLVLEGDLKEDIYDDQYYLVNSTEIKLVLNNVIAYITDSIFAQGISDLNVLSTRFTKAIDINNQATTVLNNELAKLADIDTKLQAQILQAKQVYATYDMVMSKSTSNIDPVSVTIKQYEDEIAEMLLASETKKALLAQQALDLQKEKEAKEIADALKASQAQNPTVVTEAIKEAELVQEQYDQEFKDTVEAVKDGGTIYQTTTSPTGINQAEAIKNPTTTAKKSSMALPLVIGAGALAWMFLGKGEE